MTLFKKVTDENFKPEKDNARFRVYSRQFNELIDDLRDYVVSVTELVSNTAVALIDDFVWEAGTGSDSAQQKGGGNDASGVHSTAQGRLNTASGTDSHAEGASTEASGTSSHSQGLNTTASNISSHAEGSWTTSSGENSHAEGSSTTATGDESHAEGSLTTASGDQSHSSGRLTVASGIQSYAGGNGSTSGGAASFAHSTSSNVSGDRSAILGGTGISLAEDDTLAVADFQIRKVHVIPANSADSIGGVGSITWDADFLYVKTAVGAWKRTALTTF
jgi:uncharacterized phage infection (PIP) family protein YhgE